MTSRFYQNILILELHELVPQTCRSSQKCCFTKVRYGKEIERGCTEDTMIGNSKKYISIMLLYKSLSSILFV